MNIQVKWVLVAWVVTSIPLLLVSACSNDSNDPCLPVPEVNLLPGFFVDPGGAGQFSTIQEAITAAADGDTIWLLPGVFSGAGNRDIQIQDKGVTVRSLTGDPADCVINCSGSNIQGFSGFLIDAPETCRTVLHGITITGCTYPVDASDHDDVKAIYCTEETSLALLDCVIEQNTMYFSGAIWCGARSSLELKGCRFVDNANTGNFYQYPSAVFLARNGSADISDCDFLGNSGGVALALGSFCDDVQIVRCRFMENTGRGAVTIAGSARIDSCLFVGNTSNYRGGALVLHGDYGGPLTVSNSIFRGNSARYGGAIYALESMEGYYNCLFYDNEASEMGGALYCERGAGYGNMDINSCTIVYNSSPTGSGVYVENGFVTLNQTILAFCEGGLGLHARSHWDTAVQCSNLFGNEGGQWSEEGWIGIGGNISADPLFNDVTNFDFTLSEDSPCSPGNSGCGLMGVYGVDRSE